MKKTIVAGFFVGEFGWQLMRWQGHLRYLSLSHDVIVGCESEYRYLYEDFAKGYVDYPKQQRARNMWLSNGTVHPLYRDGCESIIPSKKICLNPKLKQVFIKYGKKTDHKYNIVLHARKIDNLGTNYRNWPLGNWAELAQTMSFTPDEVISIGTTQGAHHIPGTTDGRGISLRYLADILTSGDVFISPSSGPAHFASLCGIKHIVWANRSDTGISDNKTRYLDTWNPLNTECVFIPTWQPTVDTVYGAIKKCLTQ